MDSVIPADILIVLVIVLIGCPPLWLTVRWLMARKRARMDEPVNCGDQDGWPVPMTEKRQAQIRDEWRRSLEQERPGQ